MGQEEGLQHTGTIWGNGLPPKESNSIKILLQNIVGIDMTETGSIKLAALRKYINNSQMDIYAITECKNTDWKHALAHLNPTNQTRYWESSHWSITNNTQETNKVTYPPGGMVLVITNQLSHHAQDLAMTRWVWADGVGHGYKEKQQNTKSSISILTMQVQGHTDNLPTTCAFQCKTKNMDMSMKQIPQGAKPRSSSMHR